MPKRPSPKTTPKGPRVYIAGGGISGLTAALRLAQRGYRVTVYEERPEIGGNLAAYKAQGCYYDVYPHMFGNFYRNFWDLAEGDLGLQRGKGKDFEPHYTFKVLDKGNFPDYLDLLNVASPLSNLFSGIVSPAEMLLWLYSTLDGLSYAFSDDDTLDQVSVDGFVYTRPYATPQLAMLHDTIIMTIWSVHAYATSGAAYRRFVDHNAPLPVPLHWHLTGDLWNKLMRPLEKKIESYGGRIERSTRVTQVVLENETPWETGSRVREFKISKTEFNKELNKVILSRRNAEETITLDRATGDAFILAVPPKALAILAGAGEPGQRIVDRVPQLAQVKRLAAEPIPVLNLYFKKKLPFIPTEYVLLRNSPFNLTFLDLSQNWTNDPDMDQGRTALCVAASDYYAIPWSTSKYAKPSIKSEEGRNRIIAQLYEYLPVFNPGSYWNDKNSDIDWEKTHFDDNRDRMLFANVVGAKKWQPRYHYPEISNLFFGGDSSLNPIRMATVESAVTSGLQAARGVWTSQRLGKPIEIKFAEVPPPSVVVGMKALLAPWAYAARCWSSGTSALPHLARGNFGAPEVSTAAVDLYATPGLMALDVWQSIVRTTVGYGARALGPATRLFTR